MNIFSVLRTLLVAMVFFVTFCALGRNESLLSVILLLAGVGLRELKSASLRLSFGEFLNYLPVEAGPFLFLSM
jgi:hypothetical protein